MKFPVKTLKSVIIILLYANISCSSQLPEEKPFQNSKFIEIDEIKLHYREWLQESPTAYPHVLLIHGFSGSTYSWRYTADSLYSIGYNVVAVDFPPYGYSDRDLDINTSTTAIAKTINNFKDSLYPEVSWHIIGHSMGGGIAQAMVTHYPKNIVSVVFVAGALYSQVEKNEVQAPWPLRLCFIENLLASIGDNLFITKKRVKKFLASAYGSEPSEEEVEEYYKALNIPGTSQAIIRSKTKSPEIFAFSASEINVPAYGIWGEQDSWVPLSRIKPALEKMPDVKIETIPGRGHNPMETHHEEFIKLLLEFLEK